MAVYPLPAARFPSENSGATSAPPTRCIEGECIMGPAAVISFLKGSARRAFAIRAPLVRSPPSPLRPTPPLRATMPLLPPTSSPSCLLPPPPTLLAPRALPHHPLRPTSQAALSPKSKTHTLGKARRFPQHTTRIVQLALKFFIFFQKTIDIILSSCYNTSAKGNGQWK